MKKNKKKLEFSKLLLVQESLLVWIITISMIVLAFKEVSMAYFGDIQWLSVFVGLPWAAYGVSQAFYYKKAERENTKDGIKYETAMAELKTNDNDPPRTDFTEEENKKAVG